MLCYEAYQETRLRTSLFCFLTLSATEIRTHDPPVPKLILECHGVLEPKDVDVSGRNDAVEEHDELHRGDVLHGEVEEADGFRKWAKSVTCQLRDLVSDLVLFKCYIDMPLHLKKLRHQCFSTAAIQ